MKGNWGCSWGISLAYNPTLHPENLQLPSRAAVATWLDTEAPRRLAELLLGHNVFMLGSETRSSGDCSGCTCSWYPCCCKRRLNLASTSSGMVTCGQHCGKQCPQPERRPWQCVCITHLGALTEGHPPAHHWQTKHAVVPQTGSTTCGRCTHCAPIASVRSPRRPCRSGAPWRSASACSPSRSAARHRPLTSGLLHCCCFLRLFSR